jgi:hypothetical protein
MLDRFPSPASRVISVMLPELTSRSFITFYAYPRSDPVRRHRQQPQQRSNGPISPYYSPLGHARWSNVSSGEASRSEVEMYNEQRRAAQSFDENWLLGQGVVRDWSTWSCEVRFSVDRALRDHINGGCLIPTMSEIDTDT